MSGTIRVRLAAFVLALGMLAPFGAQAADWPAFSRQAFQAAQAQGKTIMIAIHADWCVTCRAQDPLLHAVAAEDLYRDVVIFRLDYDSQRAAVYELGAVFQSTLIVFRGRDEVTRAIAVTNIDAIRDMFWLGL